MAGTIDEMIRQYQPLWTRQLEAHRLVEVSNNDGSTNHLICDLEGGTHLIEDDDLYHYVVDQMLAAGVEVMTAAAMRQLWVDLGVDVTS
jgi:hypothetical protein